MKDISLLIARLLMKVASSKEKKELERWKNQSKDKNNFYQTLESWWNHPAEPVPSPDLEGARANLLTRIRVSDAFTSGKWNLYLFKRFTAAAAIFLLLGFSSGYLWDKMRKDTLIEWMEVGTDPGNRSHITLPDGSQVWLNANTQLKYHSNKKSRRVELLGEAYFEVIPKEKTPFIVESGETSIEVLGTSFNMASYPEAPYVEASLIAGKISFRMEGQPSPVYLSPGEKVVYNKEDQTWTKFYADVNTQALWRHGILVFEKENFERLIRKLENYYAVKIVYDSEQFKGMHYTGTIRNLTISRVLEFINMTNPIEYQIDNHMIHLKPVSGKVKRE